MQLDLDALDLVDNSHTPYSLSPTLYGPSMGIVTTLEKTPLPGELFRPHLSGEVNVRIC
ncbi:TPA: hypothetical protein SAY52_005791 [Burkholderia cenocepacia]|uniref:hypothetical protein n=1 Tax=unclassified Burkholderia TaxID=2613784 RepID=UPI001588B3DC|nr:MULTISPECIES: hypothetical protein [unclassified Burkholderia]HEF5875099.1 hypothetical protein [Burkholderia cenocepacia]